MNKEYLDLRGYIEEVLDVCDGMHWKKDWSHGGCYAHLELSEFIEALRGKGDPVDELGDVLFTIFAVAGYYNIDPVKAVAASRRKMQEQLRMKAMREEKDAK